MTTVDEQRHEKDGTSTMRRIVRMFAIFSRGHWGVRGDADPGCASGAAAVSRRGLLMSAPIRRFAQARPRRTGRDEGRRIGAAHCSQYRFGGMTTVHHMTSGTPTAERTRLKG